MSPGPAFVQHTSNVHFSSQKNQHYRPIFMIQALFCPEFNQFLYKQLGFYGELYEFFISERRSIGGVTLDEVSEARALLHYRKFPI